MSARTVVTATVTAPPVLALSSTQIACNNSITTLTVTSNVSDYSSFSWLPLTNLYNDAAASIPYTGGNTATVYMKSATAGNTTYTCSASNTLSPFCANTATTIVSVQPSAAITAIASLASICVSGNTTLSFTPTAGIAAGSIQWQSSPNGTTFADISGATSSSYVAAVSTATYFKAEVRNSLGAACLQSNTLFIQVNNPVLSNPVPGSRCGIGTVSLSASASVGATINWYAAASGGTALGSGNTHCQTPCPWPCDPSLVLVGNVAHIGA